MKAFWGALILLAAVAGEKPSGSIAGNVLWEGAIPEHRKVEVDVPKGCACPMEGKLVKIDESLVVDPESKGVANGVVWIKGVKGGPVLGPAEIDQKDCVFRPHVTLLTPGQGLKVLNPEKIDHNFRTAPDEKTGNAKINKNVPKFRPCVEIPGDGFRNPEFIPMECDIHLWMKGWIAVMENGYAARTDAKGRFRIEGVPPGKYTLALWHERITPDGPHFLLEKEIVVEAGKEAQATFTMGAKP